MHIVAEKLSRHNGLLHEPRRSPGLNEEEFDDKANTECLFNVDSIFNAMMVMCHRNRNKQDKLAEKLAEVHSEYGYGPVKNMYCPQNDNVFGAGLGIAHQTRRTKSRVQCSRGYVALPIQRLVRRKYPCQPDPQ